MTLEKPGTPSFYANIDAPASIVEIREIKKICALLQKKVTLQPSKKNFRFSDAYFKSLGITHVLLSTFAGVRSTFLNIEAVSADVLALLDLDVLEVHFPVF